MSNELKAIQIKPDRPTILMADAAVLRGNLEAVPADHGAKRFDVKQWSSAEDSFTWRVNAPEAGEYHVTLLINGFDAEIELISGNHNLTSLINTKWNRIDLGILPLKSGTNELSLKAVKPGKELRLYSLELVTLELKTFLDAEAQKIRSSTAWMREAKYGLQFHWTSQSQPKHGMRKPYPDAVRDFDVDAFVQMVSETGAGYVILTTSHAEQYFPAPIDAIDRIMPGRTAERELVQELIDALGAYKIRLMLYYHVGHNHWQEPDGWWKRTGFNPDDPSVFLDNWCAITSEVGNRYGQGLAGWFFDDGCVYYPLNPDFRRLTLSAKSGNPDRVVCYNPWIWPRFTDFQDYFCGEGYQFLKVAEYLPKDGTGIFTDGPQKGLQAHTNFILEKNWVHHQPNTPISAPTIDKTVFVEDMKHAIARGIVPSVNLEIYQEGVFSELSMEYMKAVKKAVTRKSA